MCYALPRALIYFVPSRLPALTHVMQMGKPGLIDVGCFKHKQNTHQSNQNRYFHGETWGPSRHLTTIKALRTVARCAVSGERLVIPYLDSRFKSWLPMRRLRMPRLITCAPTQQLLWRWIPTGLDL